ncbi:autotransporter-associated beta strand repeat-containing protein, partial [Synechococcus sp. MU1625]|uniref:autotransporter-associated beta strand repeat-containing protein n=1 Tax=Synechococcus sp. MU1625 TaxID=2508347 RepID=UPI001CF92D62
MNLEKALVFSGLSLGLALSVSAVHAGPEGGQQITSDQMVEIWTLPSSMQTVVEGDDNKYYAINYYTYVDPIGGTKDAIPGISNGEWWDSESIGQFFPWGEDEDLAEQLSVGYKAFAEAGDLLTIDGDLILNGYTNGGGFIFNNWAGKFAPAGTQRPGDGGQKQGLLYEWNSVQYYTRGGNSNRIQAFGGCAVNTISTGEISTTGNQQLIKTAVDPCKFEGDKVREDLYAPVLQGGTLQTIENVQGEASNTDLDVPFWVGTEGGTINNGGITTIFNGKFSDVLLASFSGAGSLNFEGEGVTILAANNSYVGDTNVLEGILRVTGTLSDATAVSVDAGATYQVANSDEVGSIEGAGDIVIDDGQTLTAGGLKTNTEFSGEMSGDGGFTKVGDGITTFSGDNTYEGTTNITEGTLQVTGTLSNDTAVSVSEGATYEVANTDEVGSIEGAGDIVIDGDQTLTAGGLKTNTEFSGEISGDGGFTKVGDGTTTFSGANSYQGETTIEDGVLSLANFSGIPQGSSTLVTGVGRLNLLSGPTGKGQFKIDRLSIREGGRVLVSPSNPLVSETITLDANPANNSNPGGILTSLDGKNNPPLRVTDEFDYQSGSLVVSVPKTDDPEGAWEIIDGKVKNIDDLSENTYIVVSDDEIYSFDGLGEGNAIDGPALYRGYLEKGSLNLIIEPKSEENIVCDLHPEADGCDDEGPDKPVAPPICEGDDCKEVKPEPLPGCEEGDDLCDVISDIDGDEDEAWEVEEEIAIEIIEGLIDGLEHEKIDLPLSFDYGELATLVGSGLAPRNVDAAGRGLALHNNLLVDTLFDRQPLRQFE